MVSTCTANTVIVSTLNQITVWNLSVASVDTAGVNLGTCSYGIGRSEAAAVDLGAAGYSVGIVKAALGVVDSMLVGNYCVGTAELALNLINASLRARGYSV